MRNITIISHKASKTLSILSPGICKPSENVKVSPSGASSQLDQASRNARACPPMIPPRKLLKIWTDESIFASCCASRSALRSLVAICCCFFVCWTFNEVLSLLYFLEVLVSFTAWYYHAMCDSQQFYILCIKFLLTPVSLFSVSA